MFEASTEPSPRHSRIATNPGRRDERSTTTVGEPDTPVIQVCRRSDGVGLFYRGQYNTVFGDPETGKTMLTDYATVQELAVGGRVLRLDLEQNGANATIPRLHSLGAEYATLADQERFLSIEPEDRLELTAVIAHMAEWRPTVVILDSLGVLVPMFGGNSNSSDEFTNCHHMVIKPLVSSGACASPSTIWQKAMHLDRTAQTERSRRNALPGEPPSE